MMQTLIITDAKCAWRCVYMIVLVLNYHLQARADGCSIISVAYPFSVTPIENTAGQVPRNLGEVHIDIDYLVDKSHTCSRVGSMVNMCFLSSRVIHAQTDRLQSKTVWTWNVLE